MGKDYNLSQIAKEYATKNQCGLPLTPEQLLNSVVVYVNEEVKSEEGNQFPFGSTFMARIDAYENNVVTTEYTSNINGKKFTMKQPFGARVHGGLSVDVDEEGNTLEVGIDMTGANEKFVLTSVGNKPTWTKNYKLYYHFIDFNFNVGSVRGALYFSFISTSPTSYNYQNSEDGGQIGDFNALVSDIIKHAHYPHVGIRIPGLFAYPTNIVSAQIAFAQSSDGSGSQISVIYWEKKSDGRLVSNEEIIDEEYVGISYYDFVSEL